VLRALNLTGDCIFEFCLTCQVLVGSYSNELLELFEQDFNNNIIIVVIIINNNRQQQQQLQQQQQQQQ